MHGQRVAITRANAKEMTQTILAYLGPMAKYFSLVVKRGTWITVVFEQIDGGVLYTRSLELPVHLHGE